MVNWFPEDGKRKIFWLAVMVMVLLFLFTPAAWSAAKKMKVIGSPPRGKIYHGVFPGAKDIEEDAITRNMFKSYRQRVRKKAAWIYFSHNWFNGRRFPTKTAGWVRATGAVPFIRLMMRSSEEQGVRENRFTLGRIIRGKFDKNLRVWGRGARKFGTPLIVEFGPEVNGMWFSWNGYWNGKGRKTGYGDPTLSDGPEKFRDAYRHIVEVVRGAGATNIIWVFHVNNEDIPEKSWNRFEQYYPGDQWVDWLGVSVYGPQTPMDNDYESFWHALNRIYARLAGLTADKPIAVLEFGVADNNPRFNQAGWANKALRDLTKFRWPRIIGFSWWNEAWENDNNPAHDTTMRVQDNPNLARIFKRRVGRKKRVLGRPTLVFRDGRE